MLKASNGMVTVLALLKTGCWNHGTLLNDPVGVPDLETEE